MFQIRTGTSVEVNIHGLTTMDAKQQLEQLFKPTPSRCNGSRSDSRVSQRANAEQYGAQTFKASAYPGKDSLSKPRRNKTDAPYFLTTPQEIAFFSYSKGMLSSFVGSAGPRERRLKE
mgnify:CR=1 FL=1